MSKERYNQIIDEAYENYSKEYEKDNSIGTCLLYKRLDGKKTYRKPNKEMFVDLCYDKTFSEKWGLKIEERDLSLEERVDLMRKRTRDGTVDYDNRHHYFLDTHNVPTKQITLEYNNEKTYYYE